MDLRENLDEFTDYAARARPGLRREAFRLCGDWYEADDIVQETLWRIYRRWGALARRSEIAAYTRRALLHVFLAERRHHRWRNEITQPHPEPQGSVKQPDIVMRELLRNALDRLGPRQRTVVILRYCEDLSTPQVAAILGISTGTVASQTHRALRILRTALEGAR
jgi:RNA polymerase sigma-70 factor (sigma-E family)